MNKENKSNLVKLAKYILTNVSDEQFYMKYFRSDSGVFSICVVNFKSLNDCGTIGCALGWSPFVPGLEAIEDDFHQDGGLIFDLYLIRVFGMYRGSEWSFLFGDNWCEVDNTRKGFVKRVIYLIEGGKYISVTENHPYRKIDENKINNY